MVSLNLNFLCSLLLKPQQESFLLKMHEAALLYCPAELYQTQLFTALKKRPFFGVDKYAVFSRVCENKEKVVTYLYSAC